MTILETAVERDPPLYDEQAGSSFHFLSFVGVVLFVLWAGSKADTFHILFPGAKIKCCKPGSLSSAFSCSESNSALVRISLTHGICKSSTNEFLPLHVVLPHSLAVLALPHYGTPPRRHPQQH